MSKPEYIQFCNWIHLLELQASKGDMDGEKIRNIKQTLLVDLVGSDRKSAALESQNGAKAGTRRCQGAVRRRDPDLAGFRDRLGEDSTTTGLLPAE